MSIYNKVILDGTTLMDISDTTATAADVAQGKYFYTSGGVKTQGSASSGSTTLISKSITANGVYDAEDDSADGYSDVTVNVANSYTSGDEGKVVSNGALVAQGSDTVTQNGTVDTTLINSLLVNVSGGGGTVSGTVTPSSNLRSLTLSDCIGKTNLVIFPVSNVSSMPVNRTHYGNLFYNGRCLVRGSANSSGSAWALQTTLNGATGDLGDTWDSATGVLTISAGVTANYGGYFASGITYAYCAW